MKKKDIIQFNQYMVEADRDFLLMLLGFNKVHLISDQGLFLLLEKIQDYLDLTSDEEITLPIIKPVLILSTLTDTLRELWNSGVNIENQLKAMNTGEFDFGHSSPPNEHYFKDFEFELFTASMLCKAGLSPSLPQVLSGNDVICDGIEIQCKHPNKLNRNKVDKILKKFNSDLIQKVKYGIFGIGLDSVFTTNEDYSTMNESELIQSHQLKLLEEDRILMNCFDDTLPYVPRILGVYTISTHFSLTKITGLSLLKTSNSVFCMRKDYKRITEDIVRKVYKILSVFNNKPYIRKLDIS